MSSGAVRAGRAFVELSLLDKVSGGLTKVGAKLRAWGVAVNSTMAGAAKSVNKFGDHVMGAGVKIAAFGLAAHAALDGMEVLFARMGSEMAKLSAITGASVEDLSAMKFAFEQSGISADEMGGAITKMGRAIDGALHGKHEALIALARLGLSPQELKGKSPEEQFGSIGDAMNDRGLGNEERDTIATEIFGRGGAPMLAMLEKGSEGMARMHKRAEELHLIMSGEDAAAALKLTQSMGELMSMLKMVAFEIGSATADSTGELFGRIKEVVGSTIDWVKENKPLILTISRITLGVVAAGAALVVFGVGIKIVAGVIAGLGVIIGGIAIVFGAVLGAVGFLITPIGLIAAAIGAAVVKFGDFTKALKDLVQDGKKFWGEIVNDATDALGGIKDALSAKDFGLAAEIGCDFIKLAWIQLIKELRNLWHGFLTWYRTIGIDLGGAAGNGILTVISGWRKIIAATQHQVGALDQQQYESKLVEISNDDEKGSNNVKANVEAAKRDAVLDQLNAADDARSRELNKQIADLVRELKADSRIARGKADAPSSPHSPHDYSHKIRKGLEEHIGLKAAGTFHGSIAGQLALGPHPLSRPVDQIHRAVEKIANLFGLGGAPPRPGQGAGGNFR